MDVYYAMYLRLSVVLGEIENLLKKAYTEAEAIYVSADSTDVGGEQK